MQLWNSTNLGLNAGSLPSNIDEDNAHYISCNDFSAVMNGISLKRKKSNNFTHSGPQSTTWSVILYFSLMIYVKTRIQLG